LEFNWFTHMNQHALELTPTNANTGGTVSYSNNLIDAYDISCAPDQPQGPTTCGHMNQLQASSAYDTSWTINVTFNTQYQYQFGTDTGVFGEGFQFYSNTQGSATATFESPTLANNTFVIVPYNSGISASYLIHGNDTDGAPTSSGLLQGTGTNSDNYFDVT